MLKLINNDDYAFDDAPGTSIIPICSYGVDRVWTKKASVLTQELAEIKPKPGKTYIHVLAVGDTEKFGYNKNGDGFRAGENARCHTRFVEKGAVHKHHQNKDPSKAVGRCIASAHNADMSRIELIDELDNEKCAAEIAKYEAGEDLPVSMGCRVAYDVCSICNHKAPNPSFYCQHTKEALGRILDDGRVVGVDNPNPGYFEHSLVIRPADRIGYAFRKVASDGMSPVESSVELFKAAGIWSPEEATLLEAGDKYAHRAAILAKLAQMEKEIDGVLTPVDSAISKSAPGETLSQEDLKDVGKFGVQQLLGRMGQARVMLPVKDFIKLLNAASQTEIADPDDVGPAVRSVSHGIFGELADDAVGTCCNNAFDAPDFETTPPQHVLRLVRRIEPDAGISPDTLDRRISMVIVSGDKPSEKVSTDRLVPTSYKQDPLVKNIARAYAMYKLAVLSDNPHQDDVGIRYALHL